MKKILFFSILLLLIFSLYPEVVNPDKPLQGDWDLKAEKVWDICLPREPKTAN